MDGLIEALQNIVIPLLIPVLGWLAKAVGDLNKTLSTLQTDSALSKAAHETGIKERGLLFEKTDKLESSLAELKGLCAARHK